MSSTVLIVDDEVSILNSLSSILEDEGYEVVVAKSGSEAMSLLHGTATGGPPFDVVMLDEPLSGSEGTVLAPAMDRSKPRSKPSS